MNQHIIVQRVEYEAMQLTPESLEELLEWCPRFTIITTRQRSGSVTKYRFRDAGGYDLGREVGFGDWFIKDVRSGGFYFLSPESFAKEFPAA